MLPFTYISVWQLSSYNLCLSKHGSTICIWGTNIILVFFRWTFFLYFWRNFSSDGARRGQSKGADTNAEKTTTATGITLKTTSKAIQIFSIIRRIVWRQLQKFHVLMKFYAQRIKAKIHLFDLCKYTNLTGCVVLFIKHTIEKKSSNGDRCAIQTIRL